MHAIKVVIVDDHPVVREGIKAVLSRIDGVRIVGEAAWVQDAIHKIQLLRPHIVVMEALMPYSKEKEITLQINGIDTTFQIKCIDPEIRVIIFTMYENGNLLKPLMKAGISGYVRKQDPIVNLCRAVLIASRGGTFFSEDALSPAESMQASQHPFSKKPCIRIITERSAEDRRQEERRRQERRAQRFRDASSYPGPEERRCGKDPRKGERRHRERRGTWPALSP
jgi:DNA-binding NarL/FixJ family response regulator